MEKKNQKHRVSGDFQKALSEWNLLTRSQQDEYCKLNFNQLPQDKKEWIGVLSETVYNRSGYYQLADPTEQNKLMNGLSDQIRKWQAKQITKSILTVNGSGAHSKKDQRDLIINSLWNNRPLISREEIRNKKWDELSSDEVIWMPVLICHAFGITEKIWGKTTTEQRTKYIFRLDNCIQNELGRIVGRNLCKIRNSLPDWTQEKVAQMLGVNQNIISRLENGQNISLCYFYDLFSIYSQYVSVDGIFSEHFTVTKTSGNSRNSKKTVEITQTIFSNLITGLSSDQLEIMRQALDSKINNSKKKG